MLRRPPGFILNSVTNIIIGYWINVAPIPQMFSEHDYNAEKKFIVYPAGLKRVASC